VTIENRINKARASSYDARRQFRQVRRERSQIREQFIKELQEWRVAAMKHEILIAEIKRSHLLADYLCLPVSGPDDRVGGLPIQ